MHPQESTVIPKRKITKRHREKYLAIARSTQVFNEEEIVALEEVLWDCGDHPLDHYNLFEIYSGRRVVGFVIIDKVSITEFAWDVLWLVVDKSHQGCGFGKRLIALVETYVLMAQERAILRAETSTKKEYTHANNLYVRTGFSEVGRIDNFYAPDDDLIIYSKLLTRQ